MNIKKFIPVEKDLILLGGGHAHLSVIKKLGMYPIDGLRVTLVTNNLYTPYSGMLPGFIEGVYKKTDLNIDLLKLTNFSNARFIWARAININAKNNYIKLYNRPNLYFDYLSINIGITSKIKNIKGAKRFSVPVKPIYDLVENIEKRISLSKNNKIVIVGAGAAGFELSLAIRKRLLSKNENPEILLISKYSRVLPSLSLKASKIAHKKLLDSNIEVITNCIVKEVRKKSIITDKNEEIKCEKPIWSSSASPPKWLENSDLSLTPDGFISVTNTLQTLKHANIFAAGDISEIIENKRPRSGVYAVKSSKILEKNLRSFISNKKLKKYYPQKYSLSLIGLSNESAIADKYGYAFSSKLLWKIKKMIDKNFINKYTNLEFIKKEIEVKSDNPSDYDMLCSGCACKIPLSVLEETHKNSINNGSYDANKVPSFNNLYQSIDMISEIVSDPYQLGIISANHALSDLYACQTIPLSSQMIVSLPKAKNIIHKRDLLQINSGANKAMIKANCQITGGHSMTSDAKEISLGFSVNGLQKKKFIKSNKFYKNDRIIMTGKLGITNILSSIKLGLLEAKYLIGPLEQMLSGNKKASEALFKYNLKAITDITGFGLMQHLINFLKRYNDIPGITIYSKTLPIFPGAVYAFSRGYRSSLHISNINSSLKWLKDIKKDNILNELLYDPQTCGGLLFILSKKNTKNIINTFKSKNIKYSIIGKISNTNKKILVL